MNKKKKKWSEWFARPMRIVAMDHISFHEKWRVKVTPFQLISLILLTLIVLFFIIYLLFSYTFFGLLLPDNVLDKSRDEIIETRGVVESLEEKIAQQQRFINNLQSVILGDISIDSIYYTNEPFDVEDEIIDTSRTSEELLLEKQINIREQEELSRTPQVKKNLFLVDPVSGTISQAFHKTKHPAVDIVTKEGEAVLSCFEGVVIHTGYSDLDGWLIIVKHPNEIISVYKHCSKIIKEVGDYVRSGETIGIVGDSGERSSGPHLHFELWSAQGPLDPMDYLSFRR